MPFNYADQSLREAIIKDTDSQENIDRKKISLAQYEIFKDRVLSSVIAYLSDFYSADTMKEMPVFGCINLAKRIIIKEAGVYKCEPERTFEGVTEEQAMALEEIYDDLCVNHKFKKLNQYYKLQQQAHAQVTIIDGKLSLRTLLSHQIDVVPSDTNPEKADAYLINGFNKSMYAPRITDSDGMNEIIADADDYQARDKQIAWWSKEFNFITDERGNLISNPEEIKNPINIVPFIEIADSKDGEYWDRSGSATTDFTIQFNASLSDLAHVIRMQGFGQAYIKGSPDMIPERIVLGPNHIIKLNVNPDRPADTDFGFANANPDLAGSIQFVEMLLSAFLSARGIDPKTINTKSQGISYSSGLERLLAMLDMFEPSKDDFELFEQAESRLFEIVKAYVNTYAGSNVLKYNIAPIPESAKVSVRFQEPKMVETESDKLKLIKEKIDMGLMSKVEAISQERNVTEDKALEIAKKIEQDNSLMALSIPTLNIPIPPKMNNGDQQQ